MKNTYLMNAHTGSVDTREGWEADSETWPVPNGILRNQSIRQQMDSLVEVEKDDSGDWIEI